MPWPKGFDAERRREREWLSYARGAYKVLPGRGATLRHAAAVIVGSRHTAGEVPERYRRKCVYIPENAVDPARFSRAAAPQGAVLRACFVGRMVPYKGPDMLLESALPLLKTGRMLIEMVGDGPMLDGLKAFAAAEGVAGAVRFHGWMEHEAVQDAMAGCHMLAFPSVQEFGGGVVLEAMALGVVPLIVDYAGPGELVTEGLGWKVPIGTRAGIIAGFRVALEKAAADPGALAPMGAAARARVDEAFTWTRKAEQVRQVYDWVRGAVEKPEPFG